MKNEIKKPKLSTNSRTLQHYTLELKSPLKVQGSYKVEEADVQDILKLDFEKEYDILDFKDSIFS